MDCLPSRSSKYFRSKTFDVSHDIYIKNVSLISALSSSMFTKGGCLYYLFAMHYIPFLIIYLIISLNATTYFFYQLQLLFCRSRPCSESVLLAKSLTLGPHSLLTGLKGAKKNDKKYLKILIGADLN